MSTPGLVPAGAATSSMQSALSDRLSNGEQLKAAMEWGDSAREQMTCSITEVQQAAVSASKISQQWQPMVPASSISQHYQPAKSGSLTQRAKQNITENGQRQRYRWSVVTQKESSTTEVHHHHHHDGSATQRSCATHHTCGCSAARVSVEGST